jgi:hypothetical protein
MKDELIKKIEEIDLNNKTIIQVSQELGGVFSLSEISRAMTALKNAKQLFPKNTFGNCGINPEANPCGDACDY